MALLFVDGFDYEAYNVLLPGKWSGIAAAAFVAGRHGGLAATCSFDTVHYLYKDMETNYATLIIGFALKIPTTIYGKMLELMDGSTAHLYLTMNAARNLVLCRGDGTTLATGFSVLAIDTWYYIEIKAYISDTIGECSVRANEVVQFSISGEDTRNGANAYINRIQLSGVGTGTTYFDDFVILDTTGPAPFNDFLGFIRVDTIRPSGAGSNTEWIPSTGSNYQCVDETVQNAGTDYVVVSGEAHTDTYAMANVPVDLTGSIHAIATNVVAFKHGTAVTSVVPAMLIGGNMYSGESLDASAVEYTNYQDIHTVNPATSAAWTSGELNALEFGVIKKY